MSLTRLHLESFLNSCPETHRVLSRWIHSLYSRYADWHYCIDTQDLFPPPSSWFTTHRIFKALPIGENDHLVDIGSGKGRALLLASLFPFKRITGIEHLEPQAKISQLNWASFRYRNHSIRCQNVETLYQKAEDFLFPEDLSHVFYADSLDDVSFHAMCANLALSLQNTKKKIFFIYLYPHNDKKLSAYFKMEELFIVPKCYQRWAKIYRISAIADAFYCS